MGYIKEPDGVDFIIKSRPLTKEEEIAISNYIRSYKAKQVKKKPATRRKRKLSGKAGESEPTSK